MKSKENIQTVLVIAGSDPTGGAGLQADIKTLTMLGVYAAAVVTAVTVQNSAGVQRIEPLDPDLVQEQILAVLEDHRVSHVKIGMLGSAAVAGAVAAALRGFSGEIIYDPVMAASTGDSLAAETTWKTVCQTLLPLVTVLTPNLPEFKRLNHSLGFLSCDLPPDSLFSKQKNTVSGQTFTDRTGRKDFQEQARTIMDRLPRLRCLIVTGGHGTGETIEERCCLGHDLLRASHPKIATGNSHGTGCTFASAFTALHLRLDDDRQAFTGAVELMHHLVKASSRADIITNPSGQGPLLHYLFLNP